MAYVIGEDCIACGTCIDECPVGAISEGERYSIDADACTECGTCSYMRKDKAAPSRAAFLCSIGRQQKMRVATATLIRL